ncbi:hypothetical protein PoB_006231000 [Plakobranchus ocellatus]|uniref:Uncharacterized protein n=1 Tax=Plakobranchus ocellatus TaxID=259542 RepID=A0AAV4CVA2_9GAST|nr:hypothetical protein PoB_006231000 [Plakobranchus ocellatus]
MGVKTFPTNITRTVILDLLRTPATLVAAPVRPIFYLCLWSVGHWENRSVRQIADIGKEKRMIGESVAQWLASSPRDLQGPFCRGFEPRHRRPGLTEGPKTCDHLVVDWLCDLRPLDPRDCQCFGGVVKLEPVIEKFPHIIGRIHESLCHQRLESAAASVRRPVAKKFSPDLRADSLVIEPRTPRRCRGKREASI